MVVVEVETLVEVVVTLVALIAVDTLVVVVVVVVVFQYYLFPVQSGDASSSCPSS